MQVHFSTSDTTGWIRLWLGGVRQTFLNGADTYFVRTLVPGTTTVYYKEGYVLGSRWRPRTSCSPRDSGAPPTRRHCSRGYSLGVRRVPPGDIDRTAANLPRRGAERLCSTPRIAASRPAEVRHLQRPHTDSGWFAKQAVIESGVPHTTPHDLRHTTASLTVSAGANVKAVQRMLRHARGRAGARWCEAHHLGQSRAATADSSPRTTASHGDGESTLDRVTLRVAV